MHRNAAVTLLSKHLDTRHVDMFVSSVDKTCNMYKSCACTAHFYAFHLHIIIYISTEVLTNMLPHYSSVLTECWHVDRQQCVQVTACDAVWPHWPGWGRVPELTGSEQQPGPAAPSLAAPGRAVSCRDIVSVIISCCGVWGDSMWCSLDKWQKCCCFDVTWFRLHSAGSCPVQRGLQWVDSAALPQFWHCYCD